MLKKQTDMRSSTTNRRMTNKIPIGEGEWIGRKTHLMLDPWEGRRIDDSISCYTS